MVTQKQIARELGLAVSTVSRALTGQPHVGEATRKAVLTAAERYGYRPNAVARALRRRETRMIGVVIPDMLNHFYAACTTVLQESFEDHGYGMLLAVTGNDPQRERTALARLRDAQVEGMVLVPSATPRSTGPLDLPVVEMIRTSGRTQVDTVQCAEHETAAEAIGHLAALGHRRIAVIAGEPEFSTTRERAAGAQAALAGLGLPPARVLTRDHTRAWGTEAMRRLVTGEEPPTAVFAASSELALGALHEAQRLGIGIPGRLSLAALGNTDWFDVCRPPVTACAQPLAEVGMISAQILLSRLAGARRSPSHIRVSGRLVVRGTTSAPGAGPDGDAPPEPRGTSAGGPANSPSGGLG
ncbi:LacI family DNA-binding transcriptional regulator [Streptomyces sp. NPDC047002]|uniref:LacI family DNA-binding transcriptional regulator n=1 Tax=Streptomyces sp. NPDC047002 TaxID=3155475 RepID=UPI003452A2E9